ncbi:UbiX family flavin prenyltransferase [Sulfolobus sp. S-194]|uniref:UbiX family flavin prenyltransferase n=1 Tax=Sulfolobus sp. S-194 TaxID=2512240 RepID=UPI001436EBC6|nr:UbiX family flavin prenyltransferase [Sulfolobus sp. S-194]QIW23207.1 UbiX family flavin prenyltransferase [Sulfolobus sp. S-194]
MGEGMDKETRTESRDKKRTVIVGISGASGIIYGIRTVKVLKELGYKTEVILSKEARKVAKIECNMDLDYFFKTQDSLVYEEDQIEAPPSSSSHIVETRGMVIVPCSIKTLAEIANGIASNLLSRTALNFLRVRKRLILVVRETPLGTIELLNALKVSKAGGIIMPASPGFYHSPQGVDDLINFIVGKILDLLKISNSLYKHWHSVTINHIPCDQTS